MYTILQNIAGCHAKKLNLCCIMLIAKNKFVILNEIFFEQICIYQKLKNCTHHLRYVI